MALPLLMGAILLSVIAGWIDWRSRRIPNWLTVPGLAVGLMLNTYCDNGSGLKNSLLVTGLGVRAVAAEPVVIVGPKPSEL